MNATLKAKLIAEEGALAGTVLALENAEEWIIGRDPDECSLVLEDPSASRRHVRCFLTDEGFHIENLSSTNPVTINDESLKDTHLLEEGDLVRLGTTGFRFYTSSAEVDVEEAEEPAPPKKSPATRTPVELFDEEAPAITEEELFSEFGLTMTDSGRWMLKVISGPNAGAEYAFQKGKTYTVGNDASVCDIVLLDASVSRKHAKLIVSEDEALLQIEDLQSKNGLLVNGEKIEGTHSLSANEMVALGTSSFVVIDREGDRETIVSPPLGALGKIMVSEEAIQEATQEALKKLTKEEKAGRQETTDSKESNKKEVVKEEPPVLEQKTAEDTVGRFIKIGLIVFVLLSAFAITNLFRATTISEQVADPDAILKEALSEFTEVRYSFTSDSGTLLLLGHVSTSSQNSQMMFNLEGLKFVKKINNYVVIDELVWQEINRVLSKNAAWRSVTLQAPEPGRFVLDGYLKTQKDADILNDYMYLNFKYLDRLQNRVIVEENITKEVNVLLLEKQLLEVTANLKNGELVLNGIIGPDKTAVFDELLQEVRAIRGVKVVRNFVVEVSTQESVIDLTSDYRVTGFSDMGNVTVNVVIDGRILMTGDKLNGMTITSIRDNTIYLEKEGFKYKIVFKK